jgi:hypothetical protein
MGKNQTVQQLNREPLAVELIILLICLNVTTVVLCQVVELLSVLIPLAAALDPRS